MGIEREVSDEEFFGDATPEEIASWKARMDDSARRAEIMQPVTDAAFYLGAATNALLEADDKRPHAERVLKLARFIIEQAPLVAHAEPEVPDGWRKDGPGSLAAMVREAEQAVLLATGIMMGRS